MKLIFKGGIVDRYNVVNAETGKKVYDVARRSVMGNRYSIMSKRIKIASIEKSAYNIGKADIIIGGKNVGSAERDWTNKLTLKLENKWYISKNKDGYDVRSYGKIVGKVNCKYGLADKYEVDIPNDEDVLGLVALILALDIINYEVER